MSLLVFCFNVLHLSKILDKTDKHLLNYSYLLSGPLFTRTQCRMAVNLENMHKVLLCIVTCW